MKKILCFGDSNTFGFNPENFKQYNSNCYWASILKNKSDNYQVVIDSCNNRTIFSNPSKELNSIDKISKYNEKEFDIAILQIGINDLQFHFNPDLELFEIKLEELINITNKLAKDIIVLHPNVINECILKSYFKELFNEKSIELSKKLFSIYDKICAKYNCILIDLNKHTKTSAFDGLHYDIENHKIIADVLLKNISEIL